MTNERMSSNKRCAIKIACATHNQNENRNDERIVYKYISSEWSHLVSMCAFATIVTAPRIDNRWYCIAHFSPIIIFFSFHVRATKDIIAWMVLFGCTTHTMCQVDFYYTERSHPLDVFLSIFILKINNCIVKLLSQYYHYFSTNRCLFIIICYYHLWA